MQDDYIEELQEGFRVSEYQLDGNEQAFKQLFNEIKQSKQFYYHAFRQYQESKSTSDQSTHIERVKSLPADNTVKLEIEVEEQKAKQLQNLIQEMELKIKDKGKQTEKLKMNLLKLKLYERVSNSEEHQWRQIQYESKSQQELNEEFLNLQRGIHQIEKQKIKKQYKKVNKEIQILQNEYVAFRIKEQEMRRIINQQQTEIQQLNMHYKSVTNQKQEQYTTIFYANTLKLLEEIFFFSDPKSILKYQFEQRNQKAKIKYNTNQELDLFPTQILQQEEDNEDEELDQYLLDLIKQGNQDITNFHLDEEIISFTEYMIQTLNEFKFNFETYSNLFQQLNEKKQSLKEDFKNLVYFKYPETSNCLLQTNNKVSTVNILSSTILNNNQIDNSNQQRLQDLAFNAQKLVLRLYNFIRNHIIRINNIFLNMQKCSNLLPEYLIRKSEITKLNFLSNETIKTPVKQPKQSMTTSILNFEVGKELQIAKHSKLLANKSMTSTVYMPRKSKLASHLGLFKYQSSIQQHMKSLVQDEIDRLFVTQDLFDEFQKEVNRLCTNTDPTNEELEKILKNQEQLFRFKLKQRLSKQLQIGLQDLGEIFNKVQIEIQNLKQKGLSAQQVQYTMGTRLNFESYHSQGRTQYNSQFNSNPTSQDLSIKLDSQRELVQFMRRLTKPTIEMQQSNHQEDDDVKTKQNQQYFQSFEQERAKVKQNMYFVKNNVTQQQKYVQNQDVFQRLLPPTEQIRNFFIEQQLNSLRKDRLKIVGARSQNNSGMEIQNSLLKMKHSAERQQQKQYKSNNTFRQLFTSPLKKNKEKSQSQNKLSSVRQSQTSHQILRPHNESDDVESIWKKKHRAKRVLNAIGNKIGGRNLLQMTDLQTYI